jgi:hypothetical protein
MCSTQRWPVDVARSSIMDRARKCSDDDHAARDRHCAAWAIGERRVDDVENRSYRSAFSIAQREDPRFGAGRNDRSI